jgi:hypothetical protein
LYSMMTQLIVDDSVLVAVAVATRAFASIRIAAGLMINLRRFRRRPERHFFKIELLHRSTPFFATEHVGYRPERNRVLFDKMTGTRPCP